MELIQVSYLAIRSCGRLTGILILIVAVFSGCKKFVEVSPPVTSITGATAFSSNTSAAAVVTGIYDDIIAGPTFASGAASIGYLDGLGADELTNYASSIQEYVQFYTNTLNSTNSDPGWWNQLYQQIYVTNSVLEGLASSTGVSESIKNQLTGEAKFMRAFLHFYATTIYGDIPLVLTTNYQANNVIKRSAQAQVYTQIIADLTDAQSKLSDNFLDPYGNSTSLRIRPNKGAAAALLARAYLYTGKWDSAESEATLVIGNASTYSLVGNLDSVFLANSPETIWQLQSINGGMNTWDAYYYILTSPPGTGNANAALSTYLINAFETGDLRMAKWVGIFTADSINYYYYPYKYKQNFTNGSNPPTEYAMVLRLAEQYLIRAEARAEEGNIQGAQADLNAIRQRAGLSNTMAADQGSLLTAILHERQVELFTEWGHRWFDLIRTGNINSVLGSPGNICHAKGGTWNSDWELLPIPESEIKINGNLTENPGY